MSVLERSRPQVRRQTSAGQWNRYRPRTFYAFVSPWLLGFVLLTIFPLIYAFWLSLTNFDGLSGRWHFVGAENYTSIFQDKQAQHALVRTGIFTLMTVPTGIVIGLALAVLVNRPIRGRPVYQALLFLPSIVPIVGSALCFKLLFDQSVGPLNEVISWFGATPVSWLSDPTVFYVMVGMTLWGVGSTMIISLSGLQSIPQELTEAARVDGANAWQAFTRVTLPLLSPILLFQTVTGFIFSVQAFIPAMLLAPVSTTASVTAVPDINYLYMVHVYSQFFAFGRFGYASALLWVLFALILILTVVILKVSARTVFYESGPDDDGRRAA